MCLSDPSSLWHPSHLFSSNHPISNNLSFQKPASRISFLASLRCLSVHSSFVSLVGCPLLPWIVLACFKSIFFTSSGQRISCPLVLALKNQSVPLWPLCAQISGLTPAPASPLTCLHVWTSKSCFLRASLCSVCHLPIQKLLLPRLAWPRYTAPVPLPGQELPGTRRAKSPPSFLLQLPTVSSILALSVGAILTACAPHALAGTRPSINNFTPTFL